MGDFLCLCDASLLGDGCGTLHLSDVEVKWESRARKVEGEFGGACLQGGVDGVAALHDKLGGCFDRGFGLSPFQVEGCA